MQNRCDPDKGYEPKEALTVLLSMAIRSHSMPLRGGPDAGLVGVNPFYSERLQGELQLMALRPRELPQQEGVQPMAATGQCGLAGEANGKGRGGGTVSGGNA